MTIVRYIDVSKMIVKGGIQYVCTSNNRSDEGG